MSEFKIYNTLTSKKEIFKPIAPPRVGLYVCGITPYGPSHLGHGRCYIVFDVLRRFLEFMGYEVKYVQNITDIDDKIIKKAEQTGNTPMEIASSCMESFMGDMEKLNVLPADEYPRVSSTIPQIISFVENLVKKEIAYESGGSIYFRTGKVSGYGCLSGRKIDELRAGKQERGKEAPEDFALWKKDEKFGWDSPWGRGRPGWHIECSVMSYISLGERFDIHGGGLDLIFPHHENEIAQSRAKTGSVPANYWVHNGMVTLKGDKMAKSTGNFFLLSGLLDKYDPMVMRMYILRTGYRQAMDFDPGRLKEEAKAYNKLLLFKKELINKLEGESPDFSSSLESPVTAALLDDLNTPAAIGEIFKVATPVMDRFYSGTHTKNDVKKGLIALKVLEDVLGVKLPLSEEDSGEQIDRLVEERERFRKNREFEAADRIRKKLENIGVEVKDTPTGPRWTRKQLKN